MNESSELAALQKTFHVSALGVGDPAVGLNVLTTMACTLANLAPDDGCVAHPDGGPARLGASLLVSGGASAGRVMDEVITELGRRQRNLICQLDSHHEWLEELKKKRGASLPPPGPAEGQSANRILETQSEYGGSSGSHEEAWREVFEAVPVESIRQIEERPKFLVSAGRDLESQLTGLRPGCPLVHLGLSRPGDVAFFSETGSALLEGRYGADGGTVRANLLLTDPMRMIPEVAKVADERSYWLGHVLWLTDGEAGPEAPEETPGGTTGAEACIEERFRRVLGKVLAYRFNLPKKKPMILTEDIRAALVRWVAFLNEMEPGFPGISCSGRNLLASMVFGLGEMARAESRVKCAAGPFGQGERPPAASPLEFSVEGVEALCRFLVRRAVNARNAAIHAAAVAQRRSQIERIFRKLQTGWFEERTIYNNLNLSVADCRAGLAWLQEAGRARRKGRKWGAIEGTSLSFMDSRLPLIEV